MTRSWSPPSYTSISLEGAAGRIHVRDFGGSGPPIIALHGVTGSTAVWEGVAHALQDKFRLYAMDFRGHGLSDWSDEQRYSTSDYADDLATVLDALAFDQPPMLVGSSWGALAIIQALARQPAAGSSFALVDVEPSFGSSPTDVAPRPYKFETFNDVVNWERTANPNADEGHLTSFAAGSVTATHEGAFLRRHDPFFLTNWPFRQDDLWEELASIDLPALIVHGASSFVREEVCRKMATSCAHGSFVQIEKSGHLVPLEQPDALAREIIKFTGI